MAKQLASTVDNPCARITRLYKWKDELECFLRGLGRLTGVSVQFDCPHFLEGLRTFHLDVMWLPHQNPLDATSRPSSCPNRAFNDSPGDLIRNDTTARIPRAWQIDRVWIMVGGISNFEDFVVEIIPLEW